MATLASEAQRPGMSTFERYLTLWVALCIVAGIVRSERHSRSIIYRADLDGLRALTLFLVKDCCAGSPELCAPLLAELTPCC